MKLLMENWEKFLKEAEGAEGLKGEETDPRAAALQIVLNARTNWEGDYEFKPDEVEIIKVALGATPELKGTEEEWSQIFDGAEVAFESYEPEKRAEALKKLVGAKPKEVAKWMPEGFEWREIYELNAENEKKLSDYLYQKYRK